MLNIDKLLLLFLFFHVEHGTHLENDIALNATFVTFYLYYA